MEAINPIRVMLFWDSEIARDAYGPYFTGTIRKSWTLPTNRMISHTELHIQQQNIPITHDRNTTTLPEHITAVTQMVYDEPSMLYSTINNDDDEVDGSDGDDAVSSQSESDDDNDPEEGEFQTPLNLVNLVYPVTENIVPQWESIQWFSSARYDYTHSRAFLDMGSGSPIDDLVESSIVRLLDWNDSTTDIQLGMRFVGKVQAISAVRKWSISVGREYRVLKVRLIHGPQDVTITVIIITVHGKFILKKKTTHSRWEITGFVKEHTCLVQIEQNKHRNLSSKFISMSTSHLVANDPEIPVSNIIQEMQVLFQTGCTYKRAWYARKFAIERVFGSWEATFNILPKYLQAV
ncbi:hypothetical protein M9H77_03779 [Catharanthus roseus]|uniref:Uncharacterized protein n=1 Tax=Catharanthus roseus TaxID=4058 RepID=A0ACC0CC79_CATRO|nr:hypothetical protein M9H77_03779 [Catharanthus roseus]